MNAFWFWVVGSWIGFLASIATVVFALIAGRWAWRTHDGHLIDEARFLIIRQTIGLIIEIVLLLAALLAYFRWQTEWIVWLLVLIPWLVALRNGIDAARMWRKRGR
jgi:hypothetical protein